MTTKYIVDNLSGQTINGNITINGNLSVTGTTTGSLATYKALLTQLGFQSGTNLSSFNEGLLIGQTYTITNYVSGDDFSNIANVVSGTVNTTGCQFIATGEVPTNWNNGSTLETDGNLVVTVLENNLGYDINWINNSSGLYFGFNSVTGALYNSFDRNSTFVLSGTYLPIFGPYILDIFSAPVTFNEKDDSVIVAVFDPNTTSFISDNLFYFPIEIQVLQNTDTTPVVISGTTTSFPFNNVSIDLTCGNTLIETIYTPGGVIVNNISEVVSVLNSDSNTNILGVFSEDGLGGIILTMSTNLQMQLCADSTLTFYVFND